jgi:hypothetical protein
MSRKDNLPTIEITVEVTNFRELGSSIPSAARFKIRQPRKGNEEPIAGISGNSVQISRRSKVPIRLHFMMEKGDFMFVGLAFAESDPGSQSDRLGQKSFEVTMRDGEGARRRMETRELSVTYQGNGKKRFNYSLYIQRKASGTVGVVCGGIPDDPTNGDGS